MTSILATVTLPSLSGIPKDDVVNDFAFLSTETSGISSGVAGNIQAALADFYNHSETGVDSIASAIQSSVDRGANKIGVRIYDLTGHLNGSAHGSPVWTVFFTLNPAGSSAVNYPQEVAICLTFHSAYGSDPEFGGGGIRPRSRDRGRIYIGPLNDQWHAYSSHGVAEVSATGRSSLATLAGKLAAKTLPSMDSSFPQWAQWSRIRATLEPVVGGYVDDAFDTQRRRGMEPTTRTTF